MSRLYTIRTHVCIHLELQTCVLQLSHYTWTARNAGHVPRPALQ